MPGHGGNWGPVRGMTRNHWKGVPKEQQKSQERSSLRVGLCSSKKTQWQCLREQQLGEEELQWGRMWSGIQLNH